MSLLTLVMLIIITVSLRSVPTSGPVSPPTPVPSSKYILDWTSRECLYDGNEHGSGHALGSLSPMSRRMIIVVMGSIMDTDGFSRRRPMD